MKDQSVLLLGNTIVSDRVLIRQLEQFAKVFMNTNKSNVKSLVAKKDIDVVLFESSEKAANELDTIKTIKLCDHPPEIILIDNKDDLNLRMKAFGFGIRDEFRKPYILDLVVERVKSILVDRKIHHASSHN